MSHSDYSTAIRLLDSALALITKGNATRPAALRRRIGRLSLQLELLRARMRQPVSRLERN